MLYAVCSNIYTGYFVLCALCHAMLDDPNPTPNPIFNSNSNRFNRFNRCITSRCIAWSFFIIQFTIFRDS